MSEEKNIPQGSTLMQISIFNESLQKKMGISYRDLQWVAIGERLIKETLEAYRKVEV